MMPSNISPLRIFSRSRKVSDQEVAAQALVIVDRLDRALRVRGNKEDSRPVKTTGAVENETTH